MTLPLVDESATEQAGVALATLLRAGDLVILTGPLGAGKTTFTRGIGRGLGVRGPVASPTFVIARVHPSMCGGPDLVHVDAYRLAGPADLDDLDLEADAADSVTVVEWGRGKAEQMSTDRLDIELVAAGPDGEQRALTVRAAGPRWAGVEVEGLLA